MSCGDGENGFGKFYMRILYFTTVTYGKTDKLSWAKLGHTGCTVGSHREIDVAKSRAKTMKRVSKMDKNA